MFLNELLGLVWGESGVSALGAGILHFLGELKSRKELSERIDLTVAGNRNSSRVICRKLRLVFATGLNFNQKVCSNSTRTVNRSLSMRANINHKQQFDRQV
jgi:hypothetical protein